MTERRPHAKKDAQRRILLACAASLSIHAALFAFLGSAAMLPRNGPMLAVTLIGPGDGAAETKSGIRAQGPADSVSHNVKSEERVPAMDDAAAPAAAVPPAGSAPASAPPPSIGGGGNTVPGMADSGAPQAGEAGAGGRLAEGGTAPAGGIGAHGTAGSSDAESAMAGRILAAIEARKAYPEAARRRGTEGVVRLRLRVAADGSLIAAKLAASSGSSLLDRAALELVVSIFPVDNPADRELGCVLSVRYELKR